MAFRDRQSNLALALCGRRDGGQHRPKPDVRLVCVIRRRGTAQRGGPSNWPRQPPPGAAKPQIHETVRHRPMAEAETEAAHSSTEQHGPWQAGQTYRSNMRRGRPGITSRR
jgi:hypothetical protein